VSWNGSQGQLKAVAYTMDKLAQRHRVDVVSDDGMAIHRSYLRPEMEFRLRSLPWFWKGTVHEQELLLRSPAQMVDVFEAALASGAAKLRGGIFRDLVMNMNDYPLDFTADTEDSKTLNVSLYEKVEALSLRLMELAGRLAKEGNV